MSSGDDLVAMAIRLRDDGKQCETHVDSGYCFLLESVLNHIEDRGVILLDTEGKMIFWNSEAAELVQLTRADVGISPSSWVSYFRDPITDQPLRHDEIPATITYMTREPATRDVLFVRSQVKRLIRVHCFPLASKSTLLGLGIFMYDLSGGADDAV